MRALKSKAVVTVVTGVLVVGGAGAAYAYWSTSGTGTGTATTSTGTASLVITQTSTISNMYPGDTAQPIGGTVKNTAANSAYVATVTVSISSVTPATGVTGGCSALDYSLASPGMPVGQDVAAQGTVSFSGATIQFNDKTTNQDGCKGATVNLVYTAS